MILGFCLGVVSDEMAVASQSIAEYWIEVELGRLQKALNRGGKIFHSGRKIYILDLKNCRSVGDRVRFSVLIDYPDGYAVG